jgi:hypothetical protein
MVALIAPRGGCSDRHRPLVQRPAHRRQVGPLWRRLLGRRPPHRRGPRRRPGPIGGPAQARAVRRRRVPGRRVSGRIRSPVALWRATRLAGVEPRHRSATGPGQLERRPARVLAPLGGREACLAGAGPTRPVERPSRPCPRGTWAPWTATIGSTTTSGSGRTSAARSASIETACRVGARGSGHATAARTGRAGGGRDTAWSRSRTPRRGRSPNGCSYGGQPEVIPAARPKLGVSGDSRTACGCC